MLPVFLSGFFDLLRPFFFLLHCRRRRHRYSTVIGIIVIYPSKYLTTVGLSRVFKLKYEGWDGTSISCKVLIGRSAKGREQYGFQTCIYLFSEAALGLMFSVIKKNTMIH